MLDGNMCLTGDVDDFPPHYHNTSAHVCMMLDTGSTKPVLPPLHVMMHATLDSRINQASWSLDRLIASIRDCNPCDMPSDFIATYTLKDGSAVPVCPNQEPLDYDFNKPQLDSDD